MRTSIGNSNSTEMHVETLQMASFLCGNSRFTCKESIHFVLQSENENSERDLFNNGNELEVTGENQKSVLFPIM